MSNQSYNYDEALENALKFFQGNEFAATTYLNKYALKDESGSYVELNPQQTIDRVMRVLADAMPEKDGKPSREFVKRVFEKEFNDYKDKSWFDIFVEACGKFEGVCPQGSILSAAGNTGKPQSFSNCFVIASPEDSINGIFKASEEEAQLMKRRGGVGMCLSKLRPAGTSVANAARTSTGVPGWMDHFSNVCRSIGQNGRRGALMLTLDIKHPDAIGFAEAKKDLTYCTGANVSLKLSDEFMKCVEKGKKFTQQWPIDSDSPEIVQEVDAKKLWRKITDCAHEMAEPGLLNWDACVRNLPAHCYSEFETISCNPCAELLLSSYDSCRLITLCLIKYVDNAFSVNASFNFARFKRDIRIAMRMMDAVVEAEINQISTTIKKIEKEAKKFPTQDYSVELDLWKKIREAAKLGRRTGLGTHGLGDCLCQLNFKYDSDEALKVVDKIYKTLRDTSYDESVEMARDYGAFPIWNWETEKDCAFIKRLPKKLRDKIKKYGRRNISNLTNAPTGSISLLSLVSSGIEPTFRFLFTRRRKINDNDNNSRTDFVDQNGDKWMEFPIFEKNVERYFQAIGKEIPQNVKNDSELKEHLSSAFITSDQIDWTKRVELQGTAQKYIDHSISSTINVPNETTPEEIEEIYFHAWKKGLKGVTVYRDGCRTGVLISNDSKDTEERPEGITRSQAPKRPKKLPCEVHFTTVKGKKYVVIIGLLEGNVYEIFFGEYHNQIPKKHFSGWVEKKKAGQYLLTYIDGIDLTQVDINKYFDNKEYAAATRLISMSLRHGAPIEYVVEQLQKSSPSIVEFGSAVSRILKKYIKLEDVKKSYGNCNDCGSNNVEVKFSEGCLTITCSDCGLVDAKCG
jgi:ribonucleoside-diphosphate reductase alpha chain